MVGIKIVPLVKLYLSVKFGEFGVSKKKWVFGRRKPPRSAARGEKSKFMDFGQQDVLYVLSSYPKSD